MTIFAVPITKAGNKTIDIESDTLSDAMHKLIFQEGLKVVLNKGAGMSKVTVAKLEGEALEKARAAAYAIGEKQAEALRAGTLKVGRQTKAKGVSGAVMTEARRLAKAVVKDMIRDAGMKISHVPAKEITEAANKLIEQDKAFIEQATANLAAREAQPKPTLDIKSLISESPKLVAAAATKKAKDKKDAPLSAKQAGQTAPRAKGGGTSPTPA